MKKSFLIINFIVAFTLILNASPQRQDYFKTIEKEFQSNSVSIVNISNRYGDVTVKDWPEDKVKIVVKIRVKANSESKAQKTFDKIDITLKKEENNIYGTTDINSSINNVDFNIDYEVYMPKNLKLNLLNKYGGVFINELTNLVNLTVKYGSVQINNLTRGKEPEKNTLVIAYSKAKISNCNWLKIDAAYTDMKIGTAYALIVLSKYSNWEITKVESMVMSSKYDQPVEIGTISNLVINDGKYADYSISHLKRYLEADIKYSNIEIEDVAADFEAIKVNLRYGQFSADINSEANYSLHGEAEYGDIDVDLTKTTHVTRENTATSIDGYYGSPKSKSLVNITGKYSNIKIKN